MMTNDRDGKKEDIGFKYWKSYAQLEISSPERKLPREKGW